MDSFSVKGYHDTRMEQIAQKAQVGKGTLYEYFSNKEELFKAALEYAIESYAHEIQRNLKGKQTIEEKIIGFLEVEYRTKEKYGQFAFTFMREPKSIEMDFKDFFLRIRSIKLGLFREIIQSTVREGIYRKNLDIDRAALILMGSLNQTHFDNFSHGSNAFIEEDTLKVLELLKDGFEKKQA